MIARLRRRRDRGAETLEFALVAFVLLLLISTIVYFFYYFAIAMMTQRALAMTSMKVAASGEISLENYTDCVDMVPFISGGGCNFEAQSDAGDWQEILPGGNRRLAQGVPIRITVISSAPRMFIFGLGPDTPTITRQLTVLSQTIEVPQ